MLKINRFLLLGFGLILTMLALQRCGDKEVNSASKQTAKSLKDYGPEVKLHDIAKDYPSIYPNNGNEQKITDIAKDYLGASLHFLEAKQISKDFKPNYIAYKYEVAELPIDLSGFDKIFSDEEKVANKGNRQNVVLEFVKKGNAKVRSEHTLIVEFSELANSQDPKVKYGFDKPRNSNNKLHIKKLKSNEFILKGTEQKFLIGSSKPYLSHPLKVGYDIKDRNYFFETDAAKDELNIERLKRRFASSKEPLIDDMRYCAIVNNIKAAQNKYIKSKGYYKIGGVSRTLSSMELEADFPLRDLYKGEAIMKNLGASLSDGKSYVKLIMNDTHVGMLVDVNGYISQYQQVTVDKEKGIVDKIVLIRQ